MNEMKKVLVKDAKNKKHEILFGTGKNFFDGKMVVIMPDNKLGLLQDTKICIPEFPVNLNELIEKGVEIRKKFNSKSFPVFEGNNFFISKFNCDVEGRTDESKFLLWSNKKKPFFENLKEDNLYLIDKEGNIYREYTSNLEEIDSYLPGSYIQDYVSERLEEEGFNRTNFSGYDYDDYEDYESNLADEAFKLRDEIEEYNLEEEIELINSLDKYVFEMSQEYEFLIGKNYVPEKTTIICPKCRKRTFADKNDVKTIKIKCDKCEHKLAYNGRIPVEGIFELIQDTSLNHDDCDWETIAEGPWRTIKEIVVAIESSRFPKYFVMEKHDCGSFGI